MERPEDLRLEKFMSQKVLAEALGVSPDFLRKLREKGLPFLRLGGKVLYHETEVCRWLLENQSVNGNTGGLKRH